jgi:hypothetical protein
MFSLKVRRPGQHHEGQGGLGPEASPPHGRGTPAARTRPGADVIKLFTAAS